NKMDLPGSEENLKRMKTLGEAMGWPVFPVSAVTHEGFDEILDETARMLETLPPILHYEAEEDPDEEQVRMDTFEIVMDGGVFEVTGPGMERLIDSVNFDDLESMNWFHRMLRKMGVIDALREKGAGEGSTVRIAGMEFDFVE
ncbi:MAG: Obg family GTPase CgtA, partial [Solobacterium sp.]|nr:Obg family GTPase CgtA [Solobacterium sp.]